jgi:diketogulonate reductase-like aldo/keto reductase
MVSSVNSHLELNDGNTIPRLGLGVFQAIDGEEMGAVTHALSCGYRHIDTAAMYGNEAGVGRAIAESIIADTDLARDDIFITTKVWNERIRRGETTASLNDSMSLLGIERLDLMLLHWPVDGRVQAWKELIAAQESGRVTSIGVSNFLPEHLEELIKATGVTPAINQIEYHPWLVQQNTIDACNTHGIAVQAWSPLMRGRLDEEPVLVELASRLGRTEAQIALRWMLQKDVVVIPKSVSPARIEGNAALFDFELSAEAMAQIDAIERYERIGPDPANFNF